MPYSKKGVTAKHLIKMTEKSLREAGIVEGVFYTRKELSAVLHVSRDYFSRILKGMPYTEEYYFHPNAFVDGSCKVREYNGKDLLEFFAERDKQYGLENTAAKVYTPQT